MNKRRPSLAQWESAVERQIREAIERGDFDNLPGSGRPIPGLDRPHDEDWWIKQKLRREQLSVLPPALALRKDVEDSLGRIAATESEAEVRSIVAALNRRIVHVNSRVANGPPSTIMPLYGDAVVARWRNQAPGRGEADA